MARKSRKKPLGSGTGNEPQQAEPFDGERVPTAIYARLSNENNGRDTDDSVQTQVAIATEYMKDHRELVHVETYTDNGFSGTNFDRPAFERLMNDVRSGRIQCIIVKDLSRFGRDYLEAGYYLERVFPYLGVRFIAVNDHFDNSRKEDMENISVPVKNIINSMYARDFSRKIRSTYELKQKRGDLPGRAPYGYVISEDRDQYQIDEEAAGWVRLIFQWRMLGVSLNQIRDRLNFLKIPTRAERRKQSEGKAADKDAAWCIASVREVLVNPAYTGDLVLGQTRNEIYRGIKKYKTEKEEWIVHRDNHPAIILRPDFDAVQETFHRKDSTDPHEEAASGPNAFLGKIFCSCCGKPMNLRRRNHAHGTENYGIYTCNSPKLNSANGCRGIKENLLKMIVMDQIRQLIRTTCDQKIVVERLTDEKEKTSRAAVLKRQADALSYRLKIVGERKEKLFLDHADGLLDDEDYQQMKEQYILESQKLEKDMKETTEEVQRLEGKARLVERHIQHLEQYLDIQEFNEGLVQELVEAVYVGSNNHVEIVFKCDDVYKDFLESMEAD